MKSKFSYFMSLFTPFYRSNLQTIPGALTRKYSGEYFTGSKLKNPLVVDESKLLETGAKLFESVTKLEEKEIVKEQEVYHPWREISPEVYTQICYKVLETWIGLLQKKTEAAPSQARLRGRRAQG